MALLKASFLAAYYSFCLLHRGIFDKVKGELRLMKEELSSIERFRAPKERSLAQCNSNLEAMQTTKEGLEAELNQVSNCFLFNRKLQNVF